MHAPVRPRAAVIEHFGARLVFLLALLGALPLVVLTPPLRVPDETQHLERAYQLNEGRLLGRVQGGGAGDDLPLAFPAMARRFLGTDQAHAEKSRQPQPLAATLRYRHVPLAPDRHGFVAFSGAAPYAPFAYAPQVAGIAIGGRIGLGHLAFSMPLASPTRWWRRCCSPGR